MIAARWYRVPGRPRGRFPGSSSLPSLVIHPLARPLLALCVCAPAPAQCPTLHEAEPNGDLQEAVAIGLFSDLAVDGRLNVLGHMEEFVQGAGTDHFDVFQCGVSTPGNVIVGLTPLDPQHNVVVAILDNVGNILSGFGDNAGAGQPEFASHDFTTVQPFYVLCHSPAGSGAGNYHLIAAHAGVTCDDDCDANGQEDWLDLYSGVATDCDADGVIDVCDIASGAVLDCNTNGMPDMCDIASGASLDSDLNGVPDECECGGITSLCVATSNSTMAPCAISSTGAASTLSDDFTLHASGAVPLQFGLFFFGAEEDFTLFGDGVLCTTAPFKRLEPVVLAGAGGQASRLLDFDRWPEQEISPGSTWHFQYWYRDPFLPVGGTGFNFSDALKVTFCQ